MSTPCVDGETTREKPRSIEMAELATDGFAHIRDRAAVIEQRRGHMRERIWYTKTKNMVDMMHVNRLK